MALSDGEESLALIISTACERPRRCLGLQRVNGSWYKSSIPITQFPAWNPRPGSPHPLQLMGAVGSTPSPQALGAICSSSPPAPTAFHEPDTPFLLGKESKTPHSDGPASAMNQTGSEAGAACPSSHPCVLPRVTPCASRSR